MQPNLNQRKINYPKTREKQDLGSHKDELCGCKVVNVKAINSLYLEEGLLLSSTVLTVNYMGILTSTGQV